MRHLRNQLWTIQKKKRLEGIGGRPEGRHRLTRYRSDYANQILKISITLTVKNEGKSRLGEGLASIPGLSRKSTVVVFIEEGKPVDLDKKPLRLEENRKKTTPTSGY